MKLAGYVIDKKEHSFREPVYRDSKNALYCHEIDNRHNITSFKKYNGTASEYEPLYLSKKFNIGSKAALIFVGKEYYIHYEAAPHAIEEIIHYLNDHSSIYKLDGILDQAMLLKNRIFSDHFVVDNFVVKMMPEEEQIILSFDFPSAKKDESHAITTSQNNESAIVSKVKSAKKEENEAIFSEAIKQLNSVDMNFELKLKLRAEERRSKLKTFNYQFKLNQNSSRRKNTTE